MVLLAVLSFWKHSGEQYFRLARLGGTRNKVLQWEHLMLVTARACNGALTNRS